MAQGRVDLKAGSVGRPHGLDGSFYVTGARARLLTLGASVTVSGRTAEIVRRAGTDEHPIVRLDGVCDRPAAEALRGAAVTVSTEEAPALESGEWWAHELVGCAVVCGERRLGRVERLIELPSCEALEVSREDGDGQILVPMVKDAVRGVDVEERRIDVNLEFLGLADVGAAKEGGARDGH